MDAELLDLISRTRPVVLEILGNRGYNTAAVADTAPEELLRMAATNASLLNFKLTKNDANAISDSNGDGENKGDGQGSGGGVMHAHVLYWVEGATRLKIEGTVGKLWDDENPDVLLPERDEVIVILSEPYHEVFDLHAIKMWGRKKARMSFFNIKNLVSNPAKHSVVPPHRKLTAEETDTLMQKHHIRNKGELPRIIYHVDMQARVMGLVPGDIVEIRRPSPTSGEYVSYRVCTLS
jgi:DNA-directed RNA polymerase subunit H (RpoH/RPB5)